MATKLDKTIKREIDLDGQAYMVAISPDGVKLTQKGFRKGREITWKHLWESGSEEGAGAARGAATNTGGGTSSGVRMNSGGAGGMGGGMGGMGGAGTPGDNR
jgi:hypothetical protein